MNKIKKASLMNFQFFNSVFCCLLIFMSCNSSNNNSTQINQTEIQEFKIDSIKNKALRSEINDGSDSLKISNQSLESGNELAGRHNLTLQWISWEERGSIVFSSIGKDKYKVEGYQDGKKSKNKCTSCYLKIEGIIEKISIENLKFTGKIESSVNFIDSGKPCIKEGTFNFVAKGNRKYWRCQDMEGCDGVTDYIDIYF